MKSRGRNLKIFCEDPREKENGGEVTNTPPPDIRQKTPGKLKDFCPFSISQKGNSMKNDFNTIFKTTVTAKNLFNVSSLSSANLVFICESVTSAKAFISAGAEAVAIESINNIDIAFEAVKNNKKPFYMLALDNGETAEDGSRPALEAQKKLFKMMKAAKIEVIECNTTLLFMGEKTAEDAAAKDPEAFSRIIEKLKANRENELKAADLYKRTGAGMLEAFIDEIKTDRYKPIPTGISNIDAALQGGFISKTLITLGAAPGMGKTAIAQYIFENIAKNGRDVLYINLEMDRSQLIARSLARIAYQYQANANHKADVTALDIMRGYSWSKEQRQTIEHAAALYKEQIAPHFIYNPDGVNNNMSSILEACKSEVQRITASGADAPIICIDYLQLIRYDIAETNGKTPEAIEGLKQAIADLKNFAKDNNTVILLIIAHNRASNKEGRVTMESGRDTSVIEYTGDLMLGLNYTAIEDREIYIAGTDSKGNDKKAAVDIDYIQYKIDEADKNGLPRPDIANKLCLKILKSRFSEPGRKARFIFDGKHSTFTQIDTQRQAPQI